MYAHSKYHFVNDYFVRFFQILDIYEVEMCTPISSIETSRKRRYLVALQGIKFQKAGHTTFFL